MNSGSIPEQLRTITERVKKGERPKETVRTLLSWFDQHRRGQHVVNNIRAVLDFVLLKTDPDFELAFFDGPVEFLPALTSNQKQTTGAASSAQANKISAVRVNEGGKLPKDPVMRVDILEAANRKNLCVVNRDTPLAEAITQMATKHFSQLPVMQNPREQKVGMVSWKSIGEQMAWGRDCKFVRDCMEHAEVIPWNTPLITAVSKIVEHQVVLVRGQDAAITGLITTTDLALEFRKLSEPFLLLGEIENQIRRLILSRFSVEDFQAIKAPVETGREVADFSDLTMGDYIRLLQDPDKWRRLECKLDRKTFVDRLDSVRRIRNDVMHFHPDPVEPEDIEMLQEIARFFRAF